MFNIKGGTAMKGFFNLFKRSALEFKSIRCLTFTALLIALDLAIKLATTMRTSDTLHISFAFVALASVSMLYGPTVGFVAGLITDLLGYIIAPSGAFDIRFTLIEALGAMIYGIFLYNMQNDRWMIPRIIAAKTTVVIICNLWLTTWAVASLAGKGFLAMFPARAIKNIIQLPIDIVLLAVLLPLVLKVWQMIPGNKRVIDEKLLFCDQSVGKAMLAMTVLVLVLVFSLGFGAQNLSDQLKELKATVKAQGEQIDKYDAEIAELYEKLGIERSAEPSEEAD